MALLFLSVDNRVQAVRLDDPSHGYAEQYAYKVASYLDHGTQMRWCEVDVSTVAEFGPNDIAAMLQGDIDWTTDLPQEWETLYGSRIEVEKT